MKLYTKIRFQAAPFTGCCLQRKISYLSLSGIRELAKKNPRILLALLPVFDGTTRGTSFTMLLLSRLEYEQKACTIYVDYFLPVPVKPAFSPEGT